MKKPQSMSVKEWIIKKMAISMVVPEKTIDAVVTHQFDSANYDKLNKIKQAYERMLLDENITETKKNAVELKLQIIESSIKTLKPKINESGTNI